METLVINTGIQGINEYQDMVQPLVRFIQDNANALKEGALRLSLINSALRAEIKSGESTTVRVWKSGQSHHTLMTVWHFDKSKIIVSLLGGYDLSSDTLITPDNIKRAVSHINGLLTAYSADIKADFKIEVHYTQNI